MAWCQLCWSLLEWSQCCRWVQVFFLFIFNRMKHYYVNLGGLFVKTITHAGSQIHGSQIQFAEIEIRKKFSVKSFYAVLKLVPPSSPFAGNYWQNHYLQHTQRKKRPGNYLQSWSSFLSSSRQPLLLHTYRILLILETYIPWYISSLNLYIVGTPLVYIDIPLTWAPLLFFCPLINEHY